MNSLIKSCDIHNIEGPAAPGKPLRILELLEINNKKKGKSFCHYGKVGTLSNWTQNDINTFRVNLLGRNLQNAIVRKLNVVYCVSYVTKKVVFKSENVIIFCNKCCETWKLQS